MHESACTNAQMCMTECTEVCFSKFPYGKKKIRMSSAEDLNLSGLTSVSSKFKTFNFGLFLLNYGSPEVNFLLAYSTSNIAPVVWPTNSGA